MSAARPTPAQNRYDVVVVGARAAGAATAMLLADSGMKVLLVDRSRYGVDTLSTHALMRGGVMQPDTRMPHRSRRADPGPSSQITERAS